MSSRPGWAVALLALGACGEVPEPPWLLTEEPRVLAFRVEVSEPGPLSYDFLPIPADRVRSQPLPGDTIELSAWVVAGEREVPTQEVDPAWFLCPRSGGCVSTLSRPHAGDACVGAVPDDVACRLPDGARPRFVVPALDPQTPLEEQTFFQIAMVGHVDGQMTTAECVALVSDPSTADWSGCLVGYRAITLGPALRLVTHAIDSGIGVPTPLEQTRDEPVSPPFNPEVGPFLLFPYHGDPLPDISRGVRVTPGETTTLEPGVVYRAGAFQDPKDTQLLAEIGQTELATEVSMPRRSFFSTVPGLLEFSMSTGWLLWTPEEAGSFDVRLALYDRAGGAAWATLNLEVSDP